MTDTLERQHTTDSEGSSRDDDRLPGADADGPTGVPPVGWKQTLLRVKDQFKTDHVSLSAAGVAFQGFLALIPLIAATVSLYGLFADPQNVRNLVESMGSALPSDVALLLQNQLETIASANSGALGLGVAIGLVSGLWSASSGISHLMEGINIAYDEDPDDRPFWKRRGIAILLTFGLLVFLGIAATVVTLASSFDGLAGTAATLGAFLVAAALFAVALATLYRYGPDRDEPEWSWVSPGAAFSVVAWTIASFLFTIYVTNFGSYNETYGSLGAIVVVLLWLFLSAIIVIVGAELNTELERQTLEDSTTGPDEPIGQRNADAADNPPES